VSGAEELGGGGMFDNDDQAYVADPGQHAGYGAGGAVAGLAELLGG
jgi:hypothetical protein